jgi:hypothetical protein
MSDKDRGLYQKFCVSRNDGRDRDGDKHNNCRYFVLDMTCDKHALPAIRAYATSCRVTHPLLSRDLWKWIHAEDDRRLAALRARGL